MTFGCCIAPTAQKLEKLDFATLLIFELLGDNWVFLLVAYGEYASCIIKFPML